MLMKCKCLFVQISAGDGGERAGGGVKLMAHTQVIYENMLVSETGKDVTKLRSYENDFRWPAALSFVAKCVF